MCARANARVLSDAACYHFGRKIILTFYTVAYVGCVLREEKIRDGNLSIRERELKSMISNFSSRLYCIYSRRELVSIEKNVDLPYIFHFVRQTVYNINFYNPENQKAYRTRKSYGILERGVTYPDEKD